jgi:hypothetical protein
MSRPIWRWAFLACAAALFATPVVGQGAARGQPRPVAVRFVKSPYADYLFYLLYRNSGAYKDLEATVPLGDTPTLDQNASLPEQAASAQVASYRQLYGLLPQYRGARDRILPIGTGPRRRYRILSYSDHPPPYDKLQQVVRAGEAAYPKFAPFWRATIAPAEDRQIAAWRTQLAECRPLDKLQELTRLSFPYEHLDVAAIALHFSGSGNTDPAGVYTSLFDKPNLAWVIGHEGTHLTVDRYAGHNWYADPQAPAAIKAVEAHGGVASDIEETLALFMQVKVSQACGYSKPERRMSDNFEATTVKGAILRALEGGWDRYRADPRQDIIGYLLASTLQTFPAA